MEYPGVFFVNQEAEVALLRRLDALERTVFGRTAPSEVEVQPLMPKVEAIAKAVTRAEGGRRELEELATQGSSRYILVAFAAVCRVHLKQHYRHPHGYRFTDLGMYKCSTSTAIVRDRTDRLRRGGPQPLLGQRTAAISDT